MYITILDGAITEVETAEQEAQEEAGVKPANETEMAKDKETEGDPIEDHPKVKEAKEKLELARANAKVEQAKCEADALKGKKKDDAPVEEDQKVKPAGTENPDETKKPKKMAKKMSTEKPGDAEPKHPKETGGKEEPDEKKLAPNGKEPEKATSKAGSVGNKYSSTKLSAAERLRLEMAEDEKEEIEVKLSLEDENKRLKAELALAQEKIKVILSESKPLKVSPTTIMDSLS